jgi:hypothetical protein
LRPFATHIFLLFSATVYFFTVPAQPTIGGTFMIGDQKIYPDAKKPDTYYYIPFDYQLVTDPSGKPFFSLIQMRYTGTASTGDAGVKKYHNLLQFRIAADARRSAKLAETRAALKRMKPRAELWMMPVRKFASLLVFASSDTASLDSASLVKANHTEATDEKADVNNSFWNERTVSIRLNDIDAQLVESALLNRQSVMSFSYAFYTEFAFKDEINQQVTGDWKFVKPINEFFQNQISNNGDTSKIISIVKADVINLKVDVEKWPSLIQKVDINERLPAKYPLFDVYCYDFHQELRTDLFEKRIEIKATSVGGKDITTSYSFKQSRPDTYAKTIRFPYAVRFDMPFYYRVTEINYDGESAPTEWKQKTNWSELLDITSTPDKVVLKPKTE